MTLPDGSRAEIVHIPFHDGEILAVNHNNKPHIVLRAALESIGLDYSAQSRKLVGRSWATVVPVTTVAADGRTREMQTVDVRTFLMLLATINEKHVSDEVRPRLIEFQNEVADVIEAYWANGGAINPRANVEQLDDLTDTIEQRKADLRAAVARRDLAVIQMLDGIVDPQWRESLGRHTWAVYKGEKPDIAEEDRLLMTEPYLVERGVSRADVRSIRGVFGKRVKAAYVAEYGREPEPAPGLVDSRERPVKGYYERDRFLFDAVFDEYYLHLLPPQQLELGAA